MSIFSANKLIAGALLCCLMPIGQAQELDKPWQLQVMDLEHRVKIEATIRFTDEKARSCMGGDWKRIVVDAGTARDENFFPLHEPLAYKLEHGRLTLGRTVLCDGYLFMSGKLEEPAVQGDYYALGLGGGKNLGFFSLKKVR
jgi:hypothetical protein